MLHKLRLHEASGERMKQIQVSSMRRWGGGALFGAANIFRTTMEPPSPFSTMQVKKMKLKIKKEMDKVFQSNCKLKGMRQA